MADRVLLIDPQRSSSSEGEHSRRERSLTRLNASLSLSLSLSLQINLTRCIVLLTPRSRLVSVTIYDLLRLSYELFSVLSSFELDKRSNDETDRVSQVNETEEH